MKAEAKRFMSGRADKVHTTGPSQPRTQPVPAETSFSRKDFLAAQKEAQQLGTPGQCLIAVFLAKVAELQGVSSCPSGHPGCFWQQLSPAQPPQRGLPDVAAM